MTRLDGVDTTKLRIGRETRIEVYTKAGVWIAPERMLEQIAKGGFMARRNDVRIRVAGLISKNENGLKLALEEKGKHTQSIELTERPKSTDKASKEAPPIEKAQENIGKVVEVEGFWNQPSRTSIPSLAIISVKTK